MYALKTDPNLFHHYLINVSVRNLRSKNAGDFYLKHGPLHFTNNEVQAVQSALILSNDKLFKTPQDQALKNFGCKTLVSSIRSMQLAASSNDCTMHHFSSGFEIEEEWFETLVNVANISEHNKDLLKKSRVRGI